MAQKVIVKQLGGVEDLLLDASGQPTVTQQRAGGPVTVTKINSGTIPHKGKYGEPGYVSVAEILAFVKEQVDTLAAQGFVDLLTDQDILGNKSFNATGYLKLPVGTSAQRPGTPQDGDIRYNSELNQYEGYKNGAWGELGGGAKGGIGNKAFWENPNTITVDYTITAGQNAGSFGPITIEDGVTVTIPDGSSWTIV